MSDILISADGNPSPGSGSLVVRIPKTCKTKTSLLEWLKIGLRFPSDYGTNWDAFNEAINDLSWVPERTIVLIHEQFPPLPDKDLADYIEILRGAVEDWNVDGTKKLIVIFG